VILSVVVALAAFEMGVRLLGREPTFVGCPQTDDLIVCEWWGSDEYGVRFNPERIAREETHRQEYKERVKREAMATLVEETERHGGRLFVLLVSSRDELTALSWQYHSTRSILTEMGVPCIEVRAALSWSDYADPADPHWNNRGYAVAARIVTQAMFEALNADGLAPSSTEEIGLAAPNGKQSECPGQAQEARSGTRTHCAGCNAFSGGTVHDSR